MPDLQAYDGLLGDAIDGANSAWSVATACHFKVELGHVKLGPFTKCEGLSAEVKIEKYEEGGLNTYVHMLPGRISYPNIKVSRPINAYSEHIADVITAVNEQHDRSLTITALHPARKDHPPLATWTLREALLVKWTGPSFDVGSANALTETLEFAHHGFA